MCDSQLVNQLYNRLLSWEKTHKFAFLTEVFLQKPIFEQFATGFSHEVQYTAYVQMQGIGYDCPPVVLVLLDIQVMQTRVFLGDEIFLEICVT